MGVETATYTPDAKDEGKCLRATAMYTDGKGMEDAMGVSAQRGGSGRGEQASALPGRRRR